MSYYYDEYLEKFEILGEIIVVPKYDKELVGIVRDIKESIEERDYDQILDDIKRILEISRERLLDETVKKSLKKLILVLSRWLNEQSNYH